MKTWTDERVARLRVLFAEGCTSSQIAAVLGVATRNAVVGKIQRLGLTREFTPKRGRPRLNRPRAPKPIRSTPFHPTPPIAVTESTDLPHDWSDCAVTFAAMAPHQCRWPLWAIGATEKLYCGADKIEGTSYCARHNRVAHSPRRIDTRATQP